MCFGFDQKPRVCAQEYATSGLLRSYRRQRIVILDHLLMASIFLTQKEGESNQALVYQQAIRSMATTLHQKIATCLVHLRGSLLLQLVQTMNTRLQRALDLSSL